MIKVVPIPNAMMKEDKMAKKKTKAYEKALVKGVEKVKVKMAKKRIVAKANDQTKAMNAVN